MMRYVVSLLLALFAVTPASAESDQQRVAAFQALIAQDLRLASVGYKLAEANRAYCPVLARNPGWVIHDIAQYPDARIAQMAFPSAEPLSVSAVVPNGPAARAGVRANDGISALNDKAYNWGATTAKGVSRDRVAMVGDEITAALEAQQTASITLNRGGNAVTAVITPPQICASTFQIDTKGGINAGADGRMVSVSIALALFAEKEVELAAIVAHELAHNLLQHRAKLDAAKISRGLGSYFGKNKNAILQTEIEADQLSIWLLANAGYDPQDAIVFWQRYAKKHGTGIFTAGTHLRWKNRLKLMVAEQAAIAGTTKDANGYAPPLLLKLRAVK
jgi:beta-barrel assembly-enhancing protease